MANGQHTYSSDMLVTILHLLPLTGSFSAGTFVAVIFLIQDHSISRNFSNSFSFFVNFYLGEFELRLIIYSYQASVNYIPSSLKSNLIIPFLFPS